MTSPATPHNLHLAPPGGQQQQQQTRAPAGAAAAAGTSTAAAAASPAHRTSLPNVKRSVGDYFVDERIGSGSFASVWRAHHKENPHELRAIKSVSKEKLLTNKKHEENLAQEIDIMRRMQHPNIVRLYE